MILQSFAIAFESFLGFLGLLRSTNVSNSLTAMPLDEVVDRRPSRIRARDSRPTQQPLKRAVRCWGSAPSCAIRSELLLKLSTVCRLVVVRKNQHRRNSRISGHAIWSRYCLVSRIITTICNHFGLPHHYGLQSVACMAVGDFSFVLGGAEPLTLGNRAFRAVITQKKNCTRSAPGVH